MELITQWKIRSLVELESSITVPKKGFFVRNKTSMRLCYNIRDSIRYIYLPTPVDVAKFLQKHGVIDNYAHTDNVIKMYSKTLITTIGNNQQPVQLVKTMPVRWEDIKLNEAQVITFAAVAEFEKAGGIMGKIISFPNAYLKRA